MNSRKALDAPLFDDSIVDLGPEKTTQEMLKASSHTFPVLRGIIGSKEYEDYLDRIGYNNIVAKAKAEAGKTKALTNPAFAEYRDVAMMWIERLASRPDCIFTADDVTNIMGGPPNRFILGAVFSAMLKRKVIEKVGWTNSERISSHGRVLRTYRGKK